MPAARVGSASCFLAFDTSAARRDMAPPFRTPGFGALLPGAPYALNPDRGCTNLRRVLSMSAHPSPPRREGLAQIDPFRTEMVPVSARHTLYVEQWGAPNGVPAVALHG